MSRRRWRIFRRFGLALSRSFFLGVALGRFRRISAAAVLGLALVSSSRPVYGLGPTEVETTPEAREISVEILNSPGAPVEIKPGPKGEVGPIWGGLGTVSYFVTNRSDHWISKIHLRVALGRRDSLASWWDHAIDLGPDGLRPGGTAYVLDTAAWFLEGTTRDHYVLIVAAAESQRFSWRRDHLDQVMYSALKGSERTKLVGKFSNHNAARPGGGSECAELRKRANGLCPLGLLEFSCVAWSEDEEPQVFSLCDPPPGAFEFFRRVAERDRAAAGAPSEP